MLRKVFLYRHYAIFYNLLMTTTIDSNFQLLIHS